MAERQLNIPRAGLAWRFPLWSSQILLAIVFSTAGAMKSFMGPETLVGFGINYANDIPIWLLRLIGAAELAGSIGIVFPALTRVLPFLTPLAALGLATIQVLAIGFHFWRGELAEMWPINLMLLGLSLFVLWGRAIKAPVEPR